MTIFLYALIRAARQRMTESEVTVAMEMARIADAGEPAAADALRRMVHEVLFDRTRSQVREEVRAPQASHALHAGEL